jgi:hypothetical protein
MQGNSATAILTDAAHLVGCEFVALWTVNPLVTLGL